MERMKSSLLALLVLFFASVARGEAPAEAVKAAIDKGLRRIEQGTASYIKNRQCFSCHHQAVAIHVLAVAQARGFEVEPAKFRQQIDFTLDTFKLKRKRVAKGEAVPGGNTMAAYALFALEGGGHAADATTTALVDYLLVRQKADGSWPALMQRQPSEGSPFTNAALALRALKHYAPAQDDDDRRARVDKAFARGRDWVLQAKPEHMEDKAFRLRALVQAGAEDPDVAAARDLLLKDQKENGSWAQLADKDGDAYATGTVLAALHSAGLKPADAVYQKGVSYLLKNQRDDGAWIVTTRSRPVQTFFDNGDPGGKSQFISFLATNWAVLALLETIPPK
jgi:hypothetical protein